MTLSFKQKQKIIELIDNALTPLERADKRVKSGKRFPSDDSLVNLGVDIKFLKQIKFDLENDK